MGRGGLEGRTWEGKVWKGGPEKGIGIIYTLHFATARALEYNINETVKGH